MAAGQTFRWSRDELKRGLLKLVERQDAALDICMFIDGLDEYSNDTEHDRTDDSQDIVQLLKSLTARQNWPIRVKICVSSRPWQVFTDAFATDYNLRLQDLTQHDIQKYLTDTLGGSNFLIRLVADGNYDLDSLVRLLMDQANGVFLWVKLVTSKVLRDAQNGAELAEIYALIVDMPQALEDLFMRMLQDIPEDYLDEAARIFEIRRCSLSPPTLLDMYFACKNILDVTTAPMQEFPPENLNQIRQQMDRRIRSRCGGLLETRWVSNLQIGLRSSICTSQLRIFLRIKRLSHGSPAIFDTRLPTRMHNSWRHVSGE